MARDNAELVRDALDALNSLDFEAVRPYVHPELEWIPLRAGTEGVYRGYDGMERYLRDTISMFESFSAELDDVTELGDDRVLVKGSVCVGLEGNTLRQPAASVIWIRDGKILRSISKPTEAAALEAAEAYA